MPNPAQEEEKPLQQQHLGTEQPWSSSVRKALEWWSSYEPVEIPVTKAAISLCNSMERRRCLPIWIFLCFFSMILWLNTTCMTLPHNIQVTHLKDHCLLWSPMKHWIIVIAFCMPFFNISEDERHTFHWI